MANRVNVPGSTGCQPVLFGSLPKRNVVGKLPTTAGKLPALPRWRRAKLMGHTPHLGAFHLHLYGAADKLTSAQRESPRIMRRACDADTCISHDVGSNIGVAAKTMLSIGA